MAQSRRRLNQVLRQLTYSMIDDYNLKKLLLIKNILKRMFYFMVVIYRVFQKTPRYLKLKTAGKLEIEEN